MSKRQPSNFDNVNAANKLATGVAAKCQPLGLKDRVTFARLVSGIILVDSF